MGAMEDTRRTIQDAYPADLVHFVRERWDEDRAGPLPDSRTLETLVSACYQASLLREEERAVTFRVILCNPDRLPANEGPPGGIHRLEFPESRQFDIQEIRRLSPAADYYRSLIGVCFDEEEGLRIWGLVHSGPRWLREGQGGRDTRRPCRGPWSSAYTAQGASPPTSARKHSASWTKAEYRTSRWTCSNRAGSPPLSHR